ncbi:MAG TPA: NAD(P)(+) transhydrogenase (Re/Si-specific) subunit alpha, partial [Burkholderiales bacterium]|nr:NAD(P)(+) transhydrogenase (Re/Si-specific) subunit alpha [Burkholderiales bacterium]
MPRETQPGEIRAPLVPATTARLVKLGAEIEIERGLGESIHRADQEYRDAGAAISEDRLKSLHRADMVLRLRKPPTHEVAFLKEGCIHVSYLDPFNEHDLVRQLAAAGVSALSMEMVPRSTIAQKMDALSSQANLAGYAAVILAADRLGRIFPMMTTPAGTIRPAKVFVIGVGVAGLQAIATAKRLGAQVEAFDTRPVVEEQVRSLGAKF